MQRLTSPRIGVLVAGSVFALLCFALTACEKGTSSNSGGAPPTQVSVRFPIPIIESGQTTFYVTQGKGYYAEEKVDVRFEMGSRELNPVTMVAAGQDTFGVLGGPDTLLVARSKGQPLKAVAVIHRESNFPGLGAGTESGRFVALFFGRSF